MDYSSLVYRMPQSGGKGDPNPAPHVTDIERVFHDSFEHFRSSFITHLHELRLSHKRGDHHEVPTEQRVIPNIDMRETICDYYFDIELPGVQDKSSILIQWTSSRTLLVQGVIARPSLRDTWGPPRRCTVTGQEAQDWAMPATGAKEPSKEGETPTAAKEGETPTVAKEGETPTAAKEGEAPAGEGPASVPPKEEERKAVPPQSRPSPK